MGRKPCCDKVGLKRGPWTIDEDHKLMSFILSNGIHCWRTVPKLAGLLRCGKSCRLRWINYLRPDLKRGGFTEAEEDQIIRLHETLGNKWSKIASHFQGRTDNEIKNHWNTRIKKRLKEIMGINPAKSHKSADPKQNTNQADATTPEYKNRENQYEEVQSKNANVNKSEPNKDKDTTNALDNDDDLLLSNYEIIYGRSEIIEHWLNEESMDLSEQSLSVASLQNSLTASMNEHISLGLLENPWFDEMESFLGFSDHLDDQLFFPIHDQL